VGVLAICLGVSLALWSLFVYRQQHPPQAIPVSPPPVVVTPSPTPTPTATPTPTPTPTTLPTPNPEPPLYLTKPKMGDRIGSITFPTLDLSWVIYEGTNEAQLSKGVGHYVGSVLPGIEDNTILSGHRTTVFNRLGELKKGHEIYVKTSAGIFTYKVRSFWVVMRDNRDIIRPTRDGVLTLTTCYPFNSLTRTNKAFIVTADLVSKHTK
jgi:sortase A